MSRIESILRKARYTLSDPTAQRYTDERLLNAISEGQRDIARQTRLLKGELDIVLDLAKPLYNLPSDLWLITRASFNNTPIPLMSYDRMDAINNAWFTAFGSKVEALVYDKRNLQEIRVYPRPDKTHVSEDYTFVSDSPLVLDVNGLTAAQLASIHLAINKLTQLGSIDPLALAQVYKEAGNIINVVPGEESVNALMGVVSSVDGVVATPIFGVLSNLEFSTDYKTWPGSVTFSSPYGVTTGIEDSTGVLHINYIKDPEELTDVNGELLVPPIFDAALKWYAIGQAFSDDLDSQYQAKAGDAMAMYKRELDTVGYPTDFTDGTRSTQYSPNYNGPFGD